MVCSISILFMMLLFVIMSIACFRWRMNKGLGFTMFLLYFVFVAVSLMFEYEVMTCPFWMYSNYYDFRNYESNFLLLLKMMMMNFTHTNTNLRERRWCFFVARGALVRWLKTLIVSRSEFSAWYIKFFKNSPKHMITFWIQRAQPYGFVTHSNGLHVYLDSWKAASRSWLLLLSWFHKDNTQSLAKGESLRTFNKATFETDAFCEDITYFVVYTQPSPSDNSSCHSFLVLRSRLFFCFYKIEAMYHWFGRYWKK